MALKKKIISERIYNNGIPYDILHFFDTCINTWVTQEREGSITFLWETLRIETNILEFGSFIDSSQSLSNVYYDLTIEAVIEKK